MAHALAISLLAAAIIQCSGQAHAVDADGVFFNRGTGVDTCAEWKKDRQPEGSMAHLRTQWLLGFITAYNEHVWHRSKDVADGTNAEGLLGWVDNYCAAHPLDKVAAAADALVNELVTRYSRSHPLMTVSPPSAPNSGTKPAMSRSASPAAESLGRQKSKVE